MKEQHSTYRVLFLADICNNHTIRLIKNLHQVNPSAKIDVFYHRQDKSIDEEVQKIINNFYSIPYKDKNIHFRTIITISEIIKVFKKLAKSEKYDVVNIHFPLYYYYFIMKYAKRMTDTILLTPWGSDVYRVKGIKLKMVKRIYDKATYVCGAGNRFNDDVKRIFNISEWKFKRLDIGSDMIDYIVEKNATISREVAKQELELSDYYVIACGYNAAPVQNHKAMIDAIDGCKQQLPHKLAVIMPMTYLGTEEYINSIKQQLEATGIKYIIFNDFLSLDKLYFIRRAADLFIHVQATDANCASLQEYILCGAKILNGSWLRYKELEIDGTMPYSLVLNLDSLKDCIVEAVNSNENKINKKILSYIRNYGWKEWIKEWNQFFLSCRKN